MGKLKLWLIPVIALVIALVALLIWLFRVESVDAEEAAKMVESGAVVIDVRTPKEFEEWHYSCAVNLNLFDFHVDGLDRAKRYIVYCRSGHRSAIAVRKMRKMGFEAYNLKGGISSAKRLEDLTAEKGINSRVKDEENV